MESEIDYDLSQDTPYSTQRASSKNKPLDPGPVQQFKYDSAPKNSATTLYKSYMWDFNPQNEIHAGWQDTIHEESFEDEDLLSSYDSKKLCAKAVNPNNANNYQRGKKKNDNASK